MLGMHGTYEANLAMNRADLIICVGARFDDRVTGRLDAFSPNSTKIHIDIDRASINKTVRGRSADRRRLRQRARAADRRAGAAASRRISPNGRRGSTAGARERASPIRASKADDHAAARD